MKEENNCRKNKNDDEEEKKAKWRTTWFAETGRIRGVSVRTVGSRLEGGIHGGSFGRGKVF